MSEVIVIGGGPAGMMAAIAAADCGHHVTVIEKNEKLGKKLFITGKGRCNVTNNSDEENLLKNVMRNEKFLFSAFYSFNSERVMDFFEGEKLALKTERGNRVFPQSDKSSDVIKCLERSMKKRQITVMLNKTVRGILVKDKKVCGIYVREAGKQKFLKSDSVIVATGGISYPSTGSTGDGYEFAKEAGHTVVKPVPSLVPFTTVESFIPKMQGLSLKNVKLTIAHKNKQLYSEFGEMLFTHFGISGPLVLSASSVISGLEFEKIDAYIDMKPALDEKQLDDRILREFKSAENSLIKNIMPKILPAKMVEPMLFVSSIEKEKRVNEITRQERKELVKNIKKFHFTIDGMRGFNEAIITRGGVNVKEINPTTMESKNIDGLYFAGEVLDLDAKTGGYNLQIAWSTGYLAGISQK